MHISHSCNFSFFSHLITLLRCETQNLALVCCPIPYYLSDQSPLLRHSFWSTSPIILSPGAQTTILPFCRIYTLLNYQATLLFSLLSCRLLLMLCSSERLIFKDSYVYGTEKLVASFSSTLHSDEVSLVHPCESFETHNTTRHTNLQRRDSSASISPIEEQLERVQCFEENSRALCYHSGTLSRSRDANLTTANKAAHEHISHLSSQRANLSPKLSVTSLLTRYSFFHSCLILPSV